MAGGEMLIRHLTIGFFICLSGFATAKEAAPVASDQVGYIRVLGRLNVNTADRAQLEMIPGLDSTKVDAILKTRSEAPIADLAGLSLTDEILDHLKTEGISNLYRIRQNPLRRVDLTPASAAR